MRGKTTSPRPRVVRHWLLAPPATAAIASWHATSLGAVRPPGDPLSHRQPSVHELAAVGKDDVRADDGALRARARDGDGRQPAPAHAHRKDPQPARPEVHP